MGLGLACLRIRLLLWKTWVYRRRNWLLTLIEFLLVPLYTFLLVMATSIPQADKVNNTAIKVSFDEIPEIGLVQMLRAELNSKRPNNSFIGYVPASMKDADIKQAEDFIKKLQEQIELDKYKNGTNDVNPFDPTLPDAVKFINFGNKTAMDLSNTKWSLSKKSLLLLGIIFSTSKKKSTFKYELRFSPIADVKADSIFVGIVAAGMNKPQPGPGRFSHYYLKYAAIQILLERVLINHLLSTNLNKAATNESLTSISLQPFPYPSYKSLSPGLTMGGETIVLLIPVGFIILTVSLVRSVIIEKESGFKALLILMGIPHWMHTTAWFINAFIVGFLSLSLALCFLVIQWHTNVPPVFGESNLAILYIIAAVYTFQCFSQSFFVCAFFMRPYVAVIMQMLMSVLLSFLPMVLGAGLKKWSFTAKMFLCCLPNSAFNLIMEVFADLERQGVGAQWENIHERLDTANSIAIADILPVMAGSSIVYLVVSCYFENVIPTKYGVSKPFYYPFLASTWCSPKKKKITNEKPNENPVPTLLTPTAVKSAGDAIEPVGEVEGVPSKSSKQSKMDESSIKEKVVEDGNEEKVETEDPSKLEGGQRRRSSFEDEPIGLEAGVSVQGIRKEFRQGKNVKVAVDGVALNMFNGQITVLLGHNGAGKTTLISILTGLETPTSGTAVINGYDINKNIEEVQKDLSLCPQMNMLYNEFTVADHLVFFARLKGMGPKEAVKAMKDQIEALGLTEKEKVLARNLSGGQKRRVQLGIALIGGSKVVFLDEPTSGMDPESRRCMWDILLQVRRERTICLTTHFMEEADVLGDRIAIMEAGQVKCAGTPLFLKHYYGTGYTLHFTLKSPNPNVQSREQLEASLPEQKANETESVASVISKKSKLGETQENPKDIQLDEQQIVELEQKETTILNVVKKHVEQAKLKTGYSKKPTEIDISLPMVDDVNINSKFPAMFKELNSIKQSMNIEDFALEITTMDDVFSSVMVERRGFEKEDAEEEIIKGFKEESDGLNQKRKMSRCVLEMKQFYGLLIKKFLTTINKRALFASQVFLPLVLTIVVVASVSTNYLPIDPEGGTHIDISTFPGSITLFSEKSSFGLGSALQSRYGSKTKLKNVTTNLKKALLEVGNKQLISYRQHHIVAIEMNGYNIQGLYSTLDKHSGKVVINMISNSILEQMAKGKDLRIEMENHPLEGIGEYEMGALNANEHNKPYDFFVYSALIFCGFTLSHGTFVISVLDEKVTKAKQLQIMSGVSPISYWGSFFVWDMILSVFILSLMTACFPLLQGRLDLVSQGGGGSLFLSYLTFSAADILFLYVLSLAFHSTSLGFLTGTCIYVIIILMIAINTIVANVADVPDVVTIITSILRVHPEYGMGMLQMLYFSTALANSRCELISNKTLTAICGSDAQVPPQYRACCPKCAELTRNETPSPCFKAKKYLVWELKNVPPGFDPLGRNYMEGMGQELFLLTMLSVIYIIILFSFEYKLFQKCGSLCRSKMEAMSVNFRETVDDEDVIAEQKRVEDEIKPGGDQEDLILTTNFCKRFGSFAAVSNVSFGVRPGECFGLLGVNGAGKTTMFRMLTGDLAPSSGETYVSDKISLRTQPKNFLRSIGYTPQFDAFIPVLTGKQMLVLFARLRGIPEKQVNSEAMKWLQKLGLEKSASTRCGNYSGGMQRRLSAAMAMIGEPPIIFLDEPTSGVDPVSRRQFWKVIRSLENSGQSIILTSHSMDECEALCARLAIMVNGQLQCLGSVEHLKSKFAQGKSLDIKLKSVFGLEELPQVKQLQTDISEKFNPCILKEFHQNFLHYSLMNKEMLLDEIFTIMESLAGPEDSIIEEYSVSETTLEQVFLAFARSQYPERRAKSGCCHCGKKS